MLSGRKPETTIQLIKLISELKSAAYEARMNSYLMDINDIEAESKYFKDAIRNPIKIEDSTL